MVNWFSGFWGTRKVKFRGLGVVFGVPALFVCAYFYPRLPFIADFPICAVRSFLNFPCPGCGLTTSFTELTHGRLLHSIDAHPLGIFIAAWLCYVFLREIIESVTGFRLRTILNQRQRDVILGTFLLALIFQWLVKLFLI